MQSSGATSIGLTVGAPDGLLVVGIAVGAPVGVLVVGAGDAGIGVGDEVGMLVLVVGFGDRLVLGMLEGSTSCITDLLVLSHASPTPLPSESSWFELAIVGQLSKSPQIPSKSSSLLGSFGQKSQLLPHPSLSVST